MARLIQSKVKEPLAEEILFGQLQAGGQVVLDANNSELTLEYTGASSPVASASDNAAE
jgi:ATP-dependent Clp protease ATP-binding subunit ClpA